MTSWVRARFWIGCHTIPGQQHIVSPLRLRWVENVRVFRCKLPPAHLAEWPGYFTCYCGDTGVERTPNKSQHTQLTMEKKILHSFLPRLELATFQSRVRRSYQQAILADMSVRHTQTHEHHTHSRRNWQKNSVLGLWKCNLRFSWTYH